MSDPTESGTSRAPRWRQDFPIEWEGDHYVTRREMVKFLTLGSLLLVGANWLTVVASRLRDTAPTTPERMIGNSAALTPESPLLFRYPTEKDPCIAVRTPEGSLVAYSQVCTHLSCAVVYSKDEGSLLCPCHRGYFALVDGRPTAGPPTRRLPRVKVDERGGQIFATGVEV